MRFLSACVWFRDVISFSDASGMDCVRVKTCFYIDVSDSLLWLTLTRTQTIPDASEKDDAHGIQLKSHNGKSRVDTTNSRRDYRMSLLRYVGTYCACTHARTPTSLTIHDAFRTMWCSWANCCWQVTSSFANWHVFAPNLRNLKFCIFSKKLAYFQSV